MKRQGELNIVEIRKLIGKKELTLAGNLSLRIYGTLSCKSGTKTKIENRVFFKNETEAIQLGFRPCGHCLRDRYILWKSKIT